MSPNSSFYLYSIEAHNNNGNAIDSLTRRGALFNEAIWKTLLKDKPRAEKESLERVVFFSGSFFFSAKPLPGLEPTNLPRQILSGTEKGADGDTFTVQRVWHYTPPKILKEPVAQTSKGSALVDHRCADW